MNGISVIIPTLNRVGCLLDTVGYILSQDFKYPYEIIIVDQSQQVNQMMIGMEQNNQVIIKYHHITCFKGLPEARNYGAQCARYDYILYLDDDIECNENLLAEHYKYISQQHIGIVAGGITEKYKENPKSRNTGVFHFFSAIPERGFHLMENGYVDHAGGGNYSIKKDVFYKVGGVDEYLNVGAALYEETDICLRVKKSGYKVFFNYNAHIWHLAAPTGGCRVLDIEKYIYALVHNRSIIIHRYLNRYQRLTAYFVLVKLVLSYMLAYKNSSLFKVFRKAYTEGRQKALMPPKVTNYRHGSHRV